MDRHFRKLFCVLIVVIILLNLILFTDKIVKHRILTAQFFTVRGTRQNIEANNELSISSTVSIQKSQYVDREYLYEKRRNTISEGCKEINRIKNGRSGLASNTSFFLIDKVHSFYYCPIQKVSSSFWKRVLSVIASHGKLNSPYEISLNGLNLTKSKVLSRRDLNTLKTKGTSLVITRDPYTRLFSGYEHKLYHSNPMFWESTGREVVHVIRKDNNAVYKRYGFDVTFPEFIKYIIHQYESGLGINAHFSPMLRRCNPCSTFFEYVGKFETLKDDAQYLLTKWRKEFDDVNLRYEDFEKETVLDTANGHVNFLFNTKKILAEIKFPFKKLMLRTWRDLQIRGYLSKYIPFPFKESDVETITKDEYIKAIRIALNIPVNRTEVKLQREEALIQAYMEVPIEDMERLRQYVLQDCLLFGYDDRPAKLFDRSKRLSSDFLYLDGLKK